MSLNNEETFGMEFHFTSPIEVVETAQGKIIISGTLLVEGISRNKNLYTIDEMEKIAKSAVGKPIKYGTEAGIDPFTGRFEPNLHAQGDEHIVGKIIKTALDKAKRKIKFWAEIFNTKFHPNITESVKSGWGVSIDGIAKGGRWIYDRLKGLVLKVMGVKIRWVQLIKPEVRRGQDEAKVEKVIIQETMRLSIPPMNLTVPFPIDVDKESFIQPRNQKDKKTEKEKPLVITIVL